MEIEVSTFEDSFKESDKHNNIKLDIDKKHNIFAHYIDGKTLSQFRRALEQESNIEGALMPDAHYGYTLPIGAVIKSIDKIYPAYVGYDIGCGMCAVKLDIYKEDIENISKKLTSEIVKKIPLGRSLHKEPQKYNLNLDISNIGREIFDKVGKYHIGSLGGGNHFIEIGYNENREVWIIIHSGSRGLGGNLAKYYMDLAAKINSSHSVEDHNGFILNSNEGQCYLQDMNFALQYALDNRKYMINHIVSSIEKLVGRSIEHKQFINRNHNHAEIVENSYIIHRKGATHAEKGMLGVIPGNMRDGSFIVEGLGNRDSLYSSSHGAGRVLSRKDAKEKLDVESVKKGMKNIVSNHNGEKVDEAPEAYKNIFEVMEMQKDLVKTLEYVKPLINIKG